MKQSNRCEVFISYVREDYDKVLTIVNHLKKKGYDVWFDRDKLRGGVLWKEEIKKGISRGAGFIACFSSNYTTRSQSYMNEELNLAIEQYRKYNFNTDWFVPVKLDNCVIPNIPTSYGQTINDIHFVSFESDDEDDWILSLLELTNALPSNFRYGNKPNVNRSPLSKGVHKAQRETIKRIKETPKDRIKFILEFLEIIIETIDKSISIYDTTGEVSHVDCGEIESLLWAVEHVIKQVDEPLIQATVNQANRVLIKFTGGWGGVSRRDHSENVPSDYLKNLSGQLKGLIKWIRLYK